MPIVRMTWALKCESMYVLNVSIVPIMYVFQLGCVDRVAFVNIKQLFFWKKKKKKKKKSKKSNPRFVDFCFSNVRTKGISHFLQRRIHRRLFGQQRRAHR
jgi:uncharacterized membrane protein YkvI